MASMTPQTAKSRDAVARVITDYASRHWVSYAAGTACLLATNWLAVSIPGEIGAAVDALRDASDPRGAVWAIAWMGVAIIAVRTASRVLFFNPGRDIEYQLRGDLFSHLMRLQPSFYAGRRTGDIVSRASNDITWARALVGFGGLQLVNVVMGLSLAGWKRVALSGWLTRWALVPVVAGVAISQIGIRQLFSLQRENQEQLGAISDHVLGTLQGMATIQGFVAEDAFLDRMQDRNDAWLRTSMKLALIRSLFFPLLALSGGLSVFALVSVGGRMALEGALSVGDLATFVALLATVLPPLRSLGWMLSVVQQGRAALGRIFELLDAPVDRPEGAHGIKPESDTSPEITIQALEFAYPDQPDTPVLRGVSAVIPAGAVVGVFGRTGSGKSTLVRVLSRLYNPPRGTVLVDGVDLLDLDLDAWRERIAVVPQRPFLFSDTIARNVGLEANPTDERVARAVELAALAPDLASLQTGLETVVGERGIMLSGGQRQRVALARGLYAPRDVVLLDDVLSAVDHTTEARLLATLGTLARGGRQPTTFIVSHRISALRGADVILVMEDGRLVEQGTHAQLVARPGLYQETWHVQQSESRADGRPGAAGVAK